MVRKEQLMEEWVLYSKAVLLLYFMLQYVNEAGEKVPWVVCSLLLYVCCNVLLYIMKKRNVKLVVLLLSLIVLAMSAILLHIFFLLLLPLNIYELLFYQGKKLSWGMPAALIVLFFLPYYVQILYGFVTVFTFLTFTILARYSSRIVFLEQKELNLRKDLHNTKRNLHEKEEWKKQSQYMFKLEERNRLSQEIHDKIGHAMTGALIQMEASKQLLGRDEKKAKELLQNAINISSEGIESIRLTLKKIKPPSEQMGVNQLKTLINEFIVRTNVSTSFLYSGDLDKMGPIYWKVVYENIAEGLTNSLKYSNASEITVEVAVLNKVVKAQIKDNGTGAEKVIKGMGIIGMEERAASLNGQIIVDGSNGFSVTTLLLLSS
ncbi:sensor histidine kinase [Priestia filamentosa]|uniref:sensor histidine kinase n=1 Tax=Priestia filamentosa TaxID=1402861 RepID=UPI003982179D